VHFRGPRATEKPPRGFDTYLYALRCHEQLEVATEDKHTYNFLISYFLLIYYQNSNSYGAGVDTYLHALRFHEQREVATEDKHNYSFLMSYFI
jgi:hypothetical protein